MANAVSIKFSGFKEVDQLLKQLPKQIERKVLLSAQREVLKPVARDMSSKLRSVAGKKTGNLEKSIGIKALRGGAKYYAASMAGVRYGNKFKGFHGRFIEFGTKERKPKRKKFLRFQNEQGEWVFVRKAAEMQATPFMEPTITQHLPRISREYPDALMKGLANYMKRKLK